MLPKTAEYALRAVVCLGRAFDRRVSADQLAEQTKIPRRYLHRVLQDLVRAELASSQPGPGGGYALTRSTDTISVLEIVLVVGRLERIRSCPLGLPSHTRLCPLHQELDNVYAAAEQALARVTIGELLRSTSPIVPLCDFSNHVSAG
jgi:Rrf2 family protein